MNNLMLFLTPARLTLATTAILATIAILLSDRVVPVEAENFVVNTVNSVSGDRIAFRSLRHHNAGEIYTVRPDGTELTRLTDNTVWEGNPEFSADGQKIVFESDRTGNRDIFIMDADGTNVVNLTNSPTYEENPTLSGNGQEVAFVSTRDGNREIYVLNIASSAVRRITNNSVQDARPSFSPDGSRIVFDSEVPSLSNRFEIFAVNADGSNLTRLTDNDENDYDPQFSSDGSKVVYQRNVILPFVGGVPRLFVMNSDGSDQAHVGPDNIQSGAFSPDGTKIVFIQNLRVFIMNTNGTGIVQVTDGPSDTVPDWGGPGVDLVIKTDDVRLRPGDEFPAVVQVKSHRAVPVTITFDDPLLKERPVSDLEKDKILTLDPYELPEPFQLNPETPSRSFTVMAKVNEVGVTELVSSLSYEGGGQPGTATAVKRVNVSPFAVMVEVTPKQTVREVTEPEKKSERCQAIEITSPALNCIEIVTKVKNTSDKIIENVTIPGADDPLGLINETNRRILGEPLLEIEHDFPEEPVTLKPGAEATWIWRMDAFDAPAELEFVPTVFGVMSGREVSGHGRQTFKILDKVLLKWGMKPANGTSLVSGANIRTEGYLENVSAENGGEGKNLRVFVSSDTVGNAGGGFVAPADQTGRTPDNYHIFDLPFEGEGKRVSIKALFNTLRAKRPTDAKVLFDVKLWIVEDDGELTFAEDHELLDDEYVDEYSVLLGPEQIPVDGYKAECLKKYRPLVCSGFDGFFNDAIPGTVGLFKFGMRGVNYKAEWDARIMMIKTTAMRAAFETVLGEEAARNQLMQELYSEYTTLHQQKVFAGQVAGQLPMAFEQFSLETVDSLGRYIRAVDEGDMLEIEERTGKFLGANPDLLLEPFILMRSYLKLKGALTEMAEGTADNVYAAAEQASKRRMDASLDERIAAAKAQPGDPDLSKALLPGDTLTERLMIEIFGVDQDTVRRIQNIANEAGVVMAFRARSARASELLRTNLAWPKPQALKQKCVNRLDIDYLGYREDALGKIEIMEPPSGIRGKEGPELQAAIDEHMALLQSQRPELANAELRAEVRNRIETRAKEWTKYNPQLELYNPEAFTVKVDVNFEASFQWARDMIGDIGPKESRKIYRNDIGRRVDPATGEELRTWEIKMDGPNGGEPRWVTGDIDFLGILDINGNFINDDNKRIAIYKAMSEAQLMEHGESMSARLENARQEYLECCIFGSGEGMLTVGPWGQPRVGFFVDNRSVMNEKNAAFRKVRGTEPALGPAGEIIYENGSPRQIVTRMEDPSGEFPLINGMPTLRHVDEALVRRFAPTLWETVWENYFQDKIKMFFPDYLKKFLEDQNETPVLHSSSGTGGPVYTRGGPVVRLEPYSLIELQSSTQLQAWTQARGWVNATPSEVIAAGQVGIIDFAPYSVLRGSPRSGSTELVIDSLERMGAMGDFFHEGDWIVLDPGGPNQETALIVGMNPLTLATPLQLDHQVGEMVAWIAAPAQEAEVSGRVLLPFGRGMKNAQVTISDEFGNSVTKATNTFGYFGFKVMAGRRYMIDVKAKGYQFAPLPLKVGGDISGLEIVPIE